MNTSIIVIGEYLAESGVFIIGSTIVKKGNLCTLNVTEETFLNIVNLQKLGLFSIKSHTYLQYLQMKDIENNKTPNFNMEDIYTDKIDEIEDEPEIEPETNDEPIKENIVKKKRKKKVD